MVSGLYFYYCCVQIVFYKFARVKKTLIHLTPSRYIWTTYYEVEIGLLLVKPEVRCSQTLRYTTFVTC
jgi:hypothetical protein